MEFLRRRAAGPRRPGSRPFAGSLRPTNIRQANARRSAGRRPSSGRSVQTIGRRESVGKSPVMLSAPVGRERLLVFIQRHVSISSISAPARPVPKNSTLMNRVIKAGD